MVKATATLMTGVLLYGLAVNHEWMQSFWTPSGWARFILVMSLTAVLVLGFDKKWFYGCAAILVLQVGLSPILGLGFALLGALNLGWLIFRNDDDRLSLLGGFAIYVWIFSLTASIPMHNIWVWGLMLVIPVAIGRRFVLPLPKPSLPIALPLVAYFLLALKPEGSADGLSQHLAAIQWVRDFGRFHFDAANQIWAVQPMNGDWAYTIPALFGGEYAARLLNVVWLLLTASFVFQALRRRLDHGAASLATGVFLATPILQLSTTSLFVENFWTVMACGALFAIAEGGIVLGAALLGAAAGAKLLGILPAIGLAGYAVYKLIPAWNWKVVAQAAALYLAIACVPYVRAYQLTGNPVFHYANTIFKSPLISTTEDFVDFRYPPRFHWRTLYDVTFHTNLFVESEPGSAGYEWLLVLPLVLVTFRRQNPFERAAAITGILTLALVFMRQASVRYVIVTMALLMIASGPAITELLQYRRIATTLGLILFALNLHAMAGASWLHRDFCLKPFSWRERERYEVLVAPQRRLIREVNRIAPGVPVAFLDGDGTAGLRATSWTSTWHTPKFSIRLDAAHSVAQYCKLMQDFGVQYMIAPGSNQARMMKQTPLRTFLEEATVPVMSAGNLELVHLKTVFDPVHLKPSGPGIYDDFNTRIQYEGHWLFDDQFAEAANHTLSYTPDQGGWLHFEFTGQKLTYLFTRAPNRASAEVEIDGVKRGTYNFMSNKVEWQSRMVFDKLGPGVHTFVLRNAGPNGLHVDIDELIVE